MKKKSFKSKQIQKAIGTNKRFKEISREEALNYLTNEIRKRERAETLLKQAALELHVKDMEIESHKMYLIALAKATMAAHEIDKLYLEHEDLKEAFATYRIALEFADEKQDSVFLTLKEIVDVENNDTLESTDQKEQPEDTQEL